MATRVPSGRCALVSRSFPRTEEVAGVDRRRGQLVRLAGVAAASRTPGVSGRDAVGVGGGVAQLLEGVAPVAEVPCAVGGQFQFARLDLAEPSCEDCRSRSCGDRRSTARSSLLTWAWKALTMPHSRCSRSSASWNPSGVASSAKNAERFAYGGDRAVAVEDLSGIELPAFGVAP